MNFAETGAEKRRLIPRSLSVAELFRKYRLSDIKQMHKFPHEEAKLL